MTLYNNLQEHACIVEGWKYSNMGCRGGAKKTEMVKAGVHVMIRTLL